MIANPESWRETAKEMWQPGRSSAVFQGDGVLVQGKKVTLYKIRRLVHLALLRLGKDILLLGMKGSVTTALSFHLNILSGLAYHT